MFKKIAEDNKPPYAFCAFNTKCELWKDGFQKGAELGYNKAIDDVLEVAKGYGLISSEVGFSDLMSYENNEISEDVLWMRFEDNALRELKMAVEDLRQKID